VGCVLSSPPQAVSTVLAVRTARHRRQRREIAVMGALQGSSMVIRNGKAQESHSRGERSKPQKRTIAKIDNPDDRTWT
jgi:hypothetical protein